jgi:Endoplasmic reticulum vesicle transporter
MSHRINYLFFGDLDNISAIQRQHPEAVLSKLNGHSKNYDMQDTPHSYISHYHLDIVPTVYRNGWSATEAYQYTYNHNTFEVNHMPSLYFNYQIGGLVVEVMPDSDELSTFLIKLCAIIGGTYTIALFIDNALDAIISDKYKQYELVQ